MNFSLSRKMPEFKLDNAPLDSTSALEFTKTKNKNLLIVSSWDKTIKLFDASTNNLLLDSEYSASLLDCCWLNDNYDNTAFCAGLAKTLSMVDFSSGTSKDLGTHSDAIRCVKHCEVNGSIITGSWDKSIKQWDSRKPNAETGHFTQPNKVFSLDVVLNKIVVAMAGRSVYIYDCRNMSAPLQKRESALKYMTRTVKCMPNGDGYVSASIEGRIAVEYFDASPEWQAKKYAFKCHRQIIDNVDTVYPVNAIAFHPKYGTFASGGGDGIVSIWDGNNKKRLKNYPSYPSAISSLSFNSNGDYLAVASSYMYDEGEKEHPPDAIFIRPIEDEVKPKNMDK